MPDPMGKLLLETQLGILKPKSLVEVGCGPGELFPLYRQIPYVLAIDFSEGMLERARQRKARNGLDNIHVLRLDITANYVKSSFDLALTRTCLMHIHPEWIETAVKHVCKMSSRVLILEYSEGKATVPLAEHNWLHDYKALFGVQGYSLGYEIKRVDCAQSLMFFAKNS
jgi:SAM-dependent methyltransferase